jgi:2-oxoglutarate ferredoxin oxidoreductase subunit alpha
MPKPIVYKTPGAKVAIIAYGSTESAVIEARDLLAQEQGIKADFMRVRSVPFTQEMDEFIRKYDQIFVVEMNRDGQLHQLLSLAYPEHVMKLKSIAFGDGMPASAKWIREGILSQYAEPASVKPVKKAAAKKKAVVKKSAPNKSTAKKTKAAKSGKKGVK